MIIGRSVSMDTTSQLKSYSDQILMSLASSAKPMESIMRKYDEARDKDVFVHALAYTLLLRHRQWQSAASGDAATA